MYLGSVWFGCVWFLIILFQFEIIFIKSPTWREEGDGEGKRRVVCVVCVCC